MLLAHGYNESTAGADASVDVPNLHNIKLLLIHTCIKNVCLKISAARQKLKECEMIVAKGMPKV